jgi:hypothetical protein
MTGIEIAAANDSMGVAVCRSWGTSGASATVGGQIRQITPHSSARDAGAP